MSSGVWHATYLDNGHWCEICGDMPPNTKIYIDEYKGYNPAFWCEDCVKREKFQIIGWLENNEEYIKLMEKYYKGK